MAGYEQTGGYRQARLRPTYIAVALVGLAAIVGISIIAEPYFGSATVSFAFAGIAVSGVVHMIPVLEWERATPPLRLKARLRGGADLAVALAFVLLAPLEFAAPVFTCLFARVAFEGLLTAILPDPVDREGDTLFDPTDEAGHLRRTRLWGFAIILTATILTLFIWRAL